MAVDRSSGRHRLFRLVITAVMLGSGVSLGMPAGAAVASEVDPPAGGGTTVNHKPAHTGDFNNDGSTDLALYRPTTSNWYVWYSGTSSHLTLKSGWGTMGDQPVVADYNNDGAADMMVFRPSDGGWRVAYTGGGTATLRTGFGGAGDIPVPGDYDGDGKADLMFFRPSDGTWHLALNGGAVQPVIQYGTAGDIPVPGDYDGNGKADRALFRPSNGVWYVWLTGATSGYHLVTGFGGTGDVPLPGDFDGDGKSDAAYFHPSTGDWHVWHSTNGTVSVPRTNWGADTNYLPLTGDYDGDGRSDFALWRPSDGTWHIAYTGGGSYANPAWGTDGDITLPLSLRQAPVATDGGNKPVYFVHGYNLSGTPAIDMNDYWGGGRSFVNSFAGGTSPGNAVPYDDLVVWCYYSIDTNCTRNIGGDTSVPIQTVGRQLAWDIFYHYSIYGRPVDLVGHSMGGLVMRSALTGVFRHDPSYPPYLYVEDAVTIDTPNAGILTAVGWLCHGYDLLGALADDDTNYAQQCNDMKETSSFIADLVDAPMSTMGTDWTWIGSYDDKFITVSQSVPDSLLAEHKVAYDADQMAVPTIYVHMAVLTEDPNVINYTFCDLNSNLSRSCDSKAEYDTGSSYDLVAMARYAVYYSALY